MTADTVPLPPARIESFQLDAVGQRIPLLS